MNEYSMIDIEIVEFYCCKGWLKVDKVFLVHGFGGKVMWDFIDDVFVVVFDNLVMGDMEDQVWFDLVVM